MKFGKKTIALIGAVAMLSSVAACGSTSAGDGGSTGSSDKKVELTVWSWDSTLPRTVKGFEAKNPNIKVKVTNAGTNKDEYNALSNAIEAGSGAPDIAQIEYYALPEYVIRGHLENLSDLGASDFKDFYTPGTWSSVNINDGVYALPMDSGPMAWFYNKGVFDKAGVDPTQVRTWDDFYEAAKKIRAVDSYITSDSGDAGFFDSMTWLAGATPFETSKDGGTVTINLTGDKNVKTFTDFWQKMIDEDLIDTKTVGWTDDWNKGLDDGSIASLLTGAWMPYNLLSGAPNGDGKWRIAQMPTADGSETNSENGGSSLAIVKSDDKDKVAAAYKFMEYACHDAEGIKTRVDGGAFPADNGHPQVRRLPQHDLPDRLRRQGPRVLRRSEVQRGAGQGRSQCVHRLQVPAFRGLRSRQVRRLRRRCLHRQDHALRCRGFLAEGPAGLRQAAGLPGEVTAITADFLLWFL